MKHAGLRGAALRHHLRAVPCARHPEAGLLASPSSSPPRPLARAPAGPSTPRPASASADRAGRSGWAQSGEAGAGRPPRRGFRGKGVSRHVSEKCIKLQVKRQARPSARGPPTLPPVHPWLSSAPLPGLPPLPPPPDSAPDPLRREAAERGCSREDRSRQGRWLSRAAWGRATFPPTACPPGLLAGAGRLPAEHQPPAREVKGQRREMRN